MPGIQQWVTSPGVGFQPDELVVTLTADTAFERGDLAQAVFPTASPGIWTNAEAPTTGLTDKGNVYCVAMEVIASGAKGKFALVHPDVFCKYAGNAGAKVAAASDTMAAATGTTGEKIVAFAQATASGGGGNCAFNGLNGFGADANT